MADKKFSDFTSESTLSNITGLVGYEAGAPGVNVRISPTDLLAGIPSGSSIYTSDGTIGTTRKALITDTIQFRNSGNTSDIFTLNTDGTFAVGISAVSGGPRCVAVGRNATAYQTGNEGSIAIGDDATTLDKYSIAIGTALTEATKIGAIAIGTAAVAFTDGSIAIGYDVQSTGAAGITLSSNLSSVVNNTANAFSVYMTNFTTPDLEVIGGGDSTLNTTLKVTEAVAPGATEASAILQVDSTTKGLLPPRMTDVELAAIAGPAEGLMVFDTVNKQWKGYDGTSWVIIG
jgi:hypothetical protein